MNENIIAYEDAISRFCRLQMNTKRELPIRASEMGVMIYVEKNNKLATPLMISNFFGIAKPSVTDMVSSLIKKDYLIKIPSEADKRSYSLEVTAQGYELLKTTHQEYFSGIEFLEERMGTQEFNLLIQLLQKANKILSEMRK